MCAWYITRVHNLLSKVCYGLFVFSMVVPFQMLMFTLSSTADRLDLDTPFRICVIYLGFGAGLAVAHHNTVHLFESDYYSFVSETGGTKDANMIGQHLYSSYSGLRDTDWFKLPSPIHDTLRPKASVTENSEKVHKENEANREIFNKAIEAGRR